MIENHGESGNCGFYQCPEPEHPHWHEIDGWNNTYTCVRTLSGMASVRAMVDGCLALMLRLCTDTEDSLYCEFVDNYREYYNIGNDPWQLTNITTPWILPSSKPWQPACSCFASAKG